MKLKNVKIKIKNKEHCKTVLDRLYDLWCSGFTSRFIEENGDKCKIIYVHSTSDMGWDTSSQDNDKTCKLITLDDLYDKPEEREKIELREYICNYGEVKFLTKDLNRINLYLKRNELTTPYHKEKCTLAPNYRTIYAWADTLEYCKEGE